MKKSRFSEEPIVGILKKQRAGLPIAEICRRHGISDSRAFSVRRPKALDEENRKLTKLLAEAMLDVATLREALGKNF
jgi:putative transposase